MSASPVTVAELAPSAGDLAYLRELVRERSAIVIDPSKDYLVVSRLGPVAQREGIASLSDLVSRLRREPRSPLHDLVVDAMTTNETSFFRDAPLWSALGDTWLPELLERRRATRQLTVWHGACSSGQEPYSMAMLLTDRFPAFVADGRVRILATDLSAEMLARAASGRFTQLEVNRGLPATALARHFRRDGTSWCLDDRIRRMVELAPLNLLRPWTTVPSVDVVFLRNVLIYFAPEVKRRILARVHDVLRPDGLLLLGTAESTVNLDDRFERLTTGRASAYRPR